MAKYISLRLRPDLPTLGSGATYPTWDFQDYLKTDPNSNTPVNMKIELFDLHTNGTLGSALTTNNTILQHMAGPAELSVATAVVSVPNSYNGTVDAIVEITKGSGILIKKFVAYGLPIANTALPSSLSDYMNITPSSYIILPGNGVTYNASNTLHLPPNDLPPEFSSFNSLVINAANSLGLTPWNFSLADCQFIANKITLPHQFSPSLGPFSTSLENMYTGTSFSATVASDRNTYENMITSLLTGFDTQAKEKMTAFIYSLATAHQCQAETAQQNKALFKFPTRPAIATNPAACREMEVLLDNKVGTTSVLNPFFEVPAEAFYALSIDLETNITHKERCEQVFAKPMNSIDTILTNADANGIINLPINSLNKHQIARRLHALRIPPIGMVECAIPSVVSSAPADEIYDLVDKWLHFKGSNISDFWFTTGFVNVPIDYPLAHLRLLICGLVHDFQGVIDNSKLPLLGQGSAEDLNTLEENDWKNFLLTGTDESTKMLFVVHAKRYFKVAASTIGTPTPGNQTPSALPSGEDPITIFAKCYLEEDPKYTDKDLDNFFKLDLDTTHFPAAAACVFPNDECAREWIIEKINCILGLLIAASPCPPEIQFSVAESLYARGFCGPKSILSCTSKQFKESLTGTIAHKWFRDIYNGVNKDFIKELEGWISKCVGDPSAVQDVKEIFLEKCLDSRLAILGYTLDEILTLLDGTTARGCVEEIYIAVGGTPNTHLNQFKPINTDGQLINCIPPKHLDPCSPANYLNEMLQVGLQSTCENPFPAVPTNVLSQIQNGRRGNLGELEVTHSNLCVPIPMIDLVNESLEHMVAQGVSNGVIFNNGIAEVKGHQLLLNGATEQQDHEAYRHNPISFFEAVPEHSSAAITDIRGTAFDALINDFSAPNLPYSLPKDILKSYLDCLGVSRYKILKNFRRETHEFMLDPDLSNFDPNADEPFRENLSRYPVHQSLALEYLGFSEGEYNFLFANDPIPQGNIPTLYGYPAGVAWVNATMVVNEFLNRTGLSYCDFYCLWEAVQGLAHGQNWEFAHFTVKNSSGDEIELPVSEPCLLDDWSISFSSLSKTEGLTRLVVFIRLWQKLKDCFSIKTLRDICEELKLLNDSAPHISPGLIRKLAAIKMLHNEFHLPFNNGTDTTGNTGVNRTQILAIWKDAAWKSSNLETWNWAIRAFLDGTEQHAVQVYGADIRPSGFTELLIENLNPLSLLVGFDETPAERAWDFCPSHTIRFADFISNFIKSDFSFGEFMWIFANRHIGGDDPFPLQSESEALCFPFHSPDNETEFSLKELREKLCAIEVTEDEVNAWTWNKIETTFQKEFCLDPNDTSLLELAEKLFPETLIKCGCSVDLNKRRFAYKINNTSASNWNTINPASPFQYDSGSSNLYFELPLNMTQLYEKLSRSGQLNHDESEAVRDLVFQPCVLLARFSYLFPDFSQVWSQFISNPNEKERWASFQKSFALFYKKSKCIAAFIAQFTEAITCMERDDSEAAAWFTLKHLFAEENFPIGNASWADPNGVVPPVNWQNTPNGGALAALLGLTGTGLKREYFDLQGNLLWRDIAYSTDMFGEVQNQWNVAAPMIVPNIKHAGTFPFATVRNGLALHNSTGEVLGGGQGFKVVCKGCLWIEESGKYTFMAGIPTPQGEAPAYDDDMPQQWFIKLKKEQKEWELLGHNWKGTGAPPNTTKPIKLTKGAYECCIEYIQPNPNFDDANKVCPQTTGFQMKYTGPDTGSELMIIPLKHLFMDKKGASLTNELDAKSLAGAALDYLQQYYPVTKNDIRATFQRVMKSMVYTFRMEWSAIGEADDGKSELEFLLSNSNCFKGYSYNWNDSTSVFEEHEVILNFNVLPIQDKYCPDSLDQRRNPSLGWQRAATDLWETLCSYSFLKAKANKAPDRPAWKALKEIIEDLPGSDNVIHLFRHLGLDPSQFEQATTFYGGQPLTEEDFKKIEWLLRICQNADCIQEILCTFPFKDRTKLDPSSWAGDEKDLSKALENIVSQVRWALLECEPRRYRALKEINDQIRVNSRDALVQYLTSMGRTSFKGEIITDASGLSELLLMDITVGTCQKASRIEEAISSTQSFVQRSRLNLEDGFKPKSKFIDFWDRKMGTFKVWEKCKKRNLYPENWIEFEKLKEARKSKTFQSFEDKLREHSLTIPVSGGMTVLDSAPPPSHSPLNVLQKTEPLITSNISAANGINLLATPDIQSQPSFLSSINTNQIPYWWESAIRLNSPTVSLVASSLPSAGITYECDYQGCCNTCASINDPTPDEYHFWLVNAQYFKQVIQDANWDWDDATQLPTLLHMDRNEMVFLMSCRVHNGEIQPPRISSEGVMIDGTPDLLFLGRNGDSLNFEVENGVLPSGSFTPAIDPGFRYDIVIDQSFAVPRVDQSFADGGNVMGLSAFPYFVFFQQGRAFAPKSNYSAALLVGNHLKTHCQFEATLKWFELEIEPLQRCNTWVATGASEETTCQQSLLLHYLKTLYEWGTALMRQNTGESIQQASLIFNTAKKILGNCPVTVLDRAQDADVQTINQFVPFPAAINPQLLCLYEQIEDGFDLVHNCINVWRQSKCSKEQPFWESARNSTCSSSNDACLEEMTWCLPKRSPYRFTFLIQKALEYANIVSGLGGSLLSALEKRDAETLAAIREQHGKVLLDRNLEIKQNQYRAADFDVQAIEKTLFITESIRLPYYNFLIAQNIIPFEQSYLDNTDSSKDNLLYAKIAETAAQVLSMTIVDVNTGQNNFVRLPLGSKLAEASTALARYYSYQSSIDSINAGIDLNKASWQRRMWEWLFQVDVLTCEIEQQRRQLRAAQKRALVTKRDLNNHRIQMAHAEETHNFIRDKFTNQELYHWVQKETSGLYKQMYECALHMAHLAQQAYNLECNYSNENFLNLPIWDNLHKGLLAGEKLQLALRRMEKSYLDKNVRDYEFTKHFSLLKQFPRAFLQLKYTGRCVFELKEVYYDQDFPGQILRKIVNMSVSIPCVVGPYTNVNAKATLLSSKVRISPSLKCDTDRNCTDEDRSSYNPIPEDPRFIYRYGAKEAMATSTGNQDSGMRQLNFNDERYLLFECEGAISTWCIELLQEDNYFDICSVSDFILHLNYDAKEGGKLLADAARKEAQKHLPGDGWKLFDVPNEFPDHFYQLESAWEDATRPNELLVQLGRKYFGFIPGKHRLFINQLEIFFETCEELDCTHTEIQLLLNPKDRDEHPDKCELISIQCYQRGDMGCLFHGVVNLEKIPIPNKGIEDIGILIFPQELECISKLYLLAGYHIEKMERGLKKRERSTSQYK